MTEKDTEHQGYEGQQGHDESQMAHVVLTLSLGQFISERRLHTNKQHTGGKGHSGPNIVQHLCIIYLEKKRKYIS